MMYRSVVQRLLQHPKIHKFVKMNSTLASGKNKLEGKVAIVTASTDGIGYAIARTLGQYGARVVISSRKQANVDKALAKLQSENLQVSGMVCHVSKVEHRKKLIEETVKQYGGIDILVSNAAANPSYGPMLETSEAAWDKIFDTNVKSSFFLVKEVIPHMEKKGSGSVVFVSSIAAYEPMPLIAAYSVSKTALLGLTKALTPECAARGIRVNCVAPGFIKTTFSKALWSDESVKGQLEDRISLGRLGNPEDISGVVAFLCSDEAAYITGETIVTAGGLQSRL